MKKYIFNHTSLETALEVTDYPYGFRLRTSIFYWIETVAKKGDRFCSCTRNPKNGRMNAPKKSTFSNIGVMYLDEVGHVKWESVTIYSKKEEVQKFIESLGESNLNAEQLKQLKQLRGEKVVKVDSFDNPVKDFSVKWEKHVRYHRLEKIDKGEYSELRLTFDRPDGVKVKEIFEALKSLNQEKLNKMFEGWEGRDGEMIPGFVRVCVRGGAQITTVNKDTYFEWLASDYATVNA